MEKRLVTVLLAGLLAVPVLAGNADDPPETEGGQIAAARAPRPGQADRFAIRFGFIGVRPTGDAPEGSGREFNRQSGFEVDFEWFFTPRIGLDVSSAWSADVEYFDNDDFFSGTALYILTLGINGHVIRNERVDWSIGGVLGRSFYGDFVVGNDTSDVFSGNDGDVWGLQTSADLSIKPGSRWAINIGAKYLKVPVDLGLIDTRDADYDPVVFRVLGVFRWGR